MSVFLAGIVYSQSKDSFPSKLKKGLYYSYEDLTDNIPSVEKPFVIVPNMVMVNKTDSVLNGYKYIVQDTILKKKKIYAAYDGLHLFIAIKDEFDFYSDEKILLPVDSPARFPTMTYNLVVKNSRISPAFLFSPASLLVTAIGTAVAITTKTVINNSKSEPDSFKIFVYFNKRGKPIYPTREAMGFLLHKDKDFELEFSKEKNLTIDVYKKYIQKMNVRYPINF